MSKQRRPDAAGPQTAAQMRAEMERMAALLEALGRVGGRPDRAYRIVHVAGTKGKGTTCAAAANGSSHSSPSANQRRTVAINRPPGRCGSRRP